MLCPRYTVAAIEEDLLERISVAREEKGLSKSEVTRNMGAAISCLSAWDSGISYPGGFDQWRKLAHAVGLDFSIRWGPCKQAKIEHRLAMHLRMCRILSGLTQCQIAERLGISNVVVCHWEKLRGFPRSFSILKAWARAVGASDLHIGIDS